MKTLRFFDCNCMIGRFALRDPRQFYSLDRLKEELKYFGIEEALVYHSLAKEYSPQVGNAKLLEELSGEPNLHPCWVLMPHHTHEMPKPKDLIQEMRRNKVKAAKIFPASGSQNFSLTDWSCGELLSELQVHRIPLFLDLDQANWDNIHDICEKYPSLPLIITNVSYRIDRYLYPLLEKFENLYLEISGYFVHRGIEAICKNFGPQRLLFGSRLPFFSPGATIALVNYAKISQADKKLVAEGNLRRLLGEAKL